jgi:hypothetical protein
MLRIRSLAVVGGGALALWLALPGFVNYDMAYALVWGGQLGDGRLPQYDAPLSPTPHPLATLLGLALAPLGDQAAAAAVALGFVSLAALGLVVYRLGTDWFGAAAGVLAAAIVLTWAPVLSFGARAYVDIPYLVVVLGALLVETRRPRAGRPVLVLLTLAGLLRPEAWLFAGGYAIYAARGHSRRSRVELLALVAVAPVAWLLSDLAVTGDALHSFTWTRDAAARLGRARGAAALPHALPGRLIAVTGATVLAGAALGAALAWLHGDRRARLAALAPAGALGACVALTAAGMPVTMRYVLLPATLLAIVCAGAVVAWRAQPRRLSIAGGVTVLVLLAASLPGRLQSIAALRDRLAPQAAIRADLRALAKTGAVRRSCAPIAVSNRRLVPLLALALGRGPTDFRTGPAARSTGGYYVGPATPAAQRTLLLASSDPPEPAARPPTGSRLLARRHAWELYGRC